MLEKESVCIDEIVDRALELCRELPLAEASGYRDLVTDCKSRLSQGRLHLAVLGQFNRGKSSFINALLGTNILPTSVLPLTTVPTIIKYGTDESCLVRFLDESQDVVCKGSLKEIQAVLRKYVTEEHNHRNKYNVQEAEVSCPCPLLQNGTVLIDTPGFGSTYLHNTKTTFDLLSDCDAALFVLSADLPITQNEIEFLREASAHIPHFIFVLNKIDLLSPSDLQKTDLFIRAVLQKNFPEIPNIELFGVSARTATLAKNHASDDAYWADSRMGQIEQLIADFLAREKYFVLSQAISDKFKSVFDEIVGQLTIKREDLLAPVKALEIQITGLETAGGRLKEKTEKEIDLVGLEKKALYDFLATVLDQKKTGIKAQLDEALGVVLESSLNYSDPDKAIRSTLPSLLTELFNLALIQIITQVSRPYKKAVTAHGREFLKTRGEFENFRQQDFAKLTPEVFFELEIAAEGHLERSPGNLPNVELTLFERLKSRQKKQALIRERSQQSIESAINSQSQNLVIHIKNLIDDAAKRLVAVLERHYGAMGEQLLALKKETQVAHDCLQQETQSDSTLLADLIDKFTELRKLLV